MGSAAFPSAITHLGFDLGGTKIEAVALSQTGQQLSRRRLPTPHHPDPDKQVQAIGETLRQLKQMVLQESSGRWLLRMMPTALRWLKPIVVNQLGDSAGVLGAAWLGAQGTSEKAFCPNMRKFD